MKKKLQKKIEKLEKQNNSLKAEIFLREMEICRLRKLLGTKDDTLHTNVPEEDVDYSKMLQKLSKQQEILFEHVQNLHEDAEAPTLWRRVVKFKKSVMTRPVMVDRSDTRAPSVIIKMGATKVMIEDREVHIASPYIDESYSSIKVNSPMSI